MSEVTIDRISIEVEANTKSAVASLRNLQAQIRGIQTKMSSGRMGGSSRSGGLFNIGSLGKVYLATRAVKELGDATANAVKKSADYVEVLNLYTVSMGKFADQGQQFIDRFSGKLGLDPAQVMRFQGVFNDLTKTMGNSAEESYLMSKNLAQLSYDMASFRNIPVDQSFNKLVSAMTRVSKPMRVMGVAVGEAALNEKLLAMGYTMSYRALSEASKQQLIYVKIMDDTRHMQGDMARTLISPANMMRVLAQNVELAGRAIGNIFIPAMNAILPYAIATLEIITELANAFAALIGFKLPEFDYSGLDDGEDALEDIEEGAKKTAKALKGVTAPFDELHDISQSAAGGAGGKKSGLNIDFDLAKRDYDATIGAMRKQIDDAKKSIKEFFEAFKNTTAGKILSFIWEQLKKIKVSLGNLTTKEWAKLASDILLIIGALAGFKAIVGIVSFIMGAIPVLTAVFQGLGAVIATVFSPLGLIIIGVVAGITAFVAATMHLYKTNKEFKDSFDALGKSISDTFAPLGELGVKVFKDLGDSMDAFWSQHGKPIVDGFFAALKAVWDVMIALWDNVLKPIIDNIGTSLTWLWENHLKPLVDAVLDLVGAIAEGVLMLWSEVLAPIVQWLIRVFGPIISTVFNGIWNVVATVFGAVADVVTGAIKILTGLINFITGVFTGDWDMAWKGILKIFEGIWIAIKGIVFGISNIIIDIINVLIKGVVSGFVGLVNFLAGVINLIVKAVLAPINLVIDGLNKIPGVKISKISLAIPDWKPDLSGVPQIPKLANGGILPSSADIFMANEGGRAEMIGRYGNQTAVANQGQLVDGISDGVAVGMTNANQNVVSALNVVVGVLRDIYAVTGTNDVDVAKAARRGEERLGAIMSGNSAFGYS